MSDAGRKIHARAKLKTLPAETQARVAAWCAEGTLSSARARCSSELSISTSLDALSKFFRWWTARQEAEARKATLKELMDRADANAKAVGEMLKERGATASQIAAADHLVFQLQATAGGEASTPEQLALSIELEKLRIAREGMELKARNDAAKLRQKDREITLAKERFEFDGAKAALAHLKDLKSISADRALSEPEKIAAVRLKLFGTPRTPVEAANP